MLTHTRSFFHLCDHTDKHLAGWFCCIENLHLNIFSGHTSTPPPWQFGQQFAHSAQLIVGPHCLILELKLSIRFLAALTSALSSQWRLATRPNYPPLAKPGQLFPEPGLLKEDGAGGWWKNLTLWESVSGGGRLLTGDAQHHTCRGALKASWSHGAGCYPQRQREKEREETGLQWMIQELAATINISADIKTGIIILCAFKMIWNLGAEWALYLSLLAPLLAREELILDLSIPSHLSGTNTKMKVKVMNLLKVLYEWCWNYFSRDKDFGFRSSFERILEVVAHIAYMRHLFIAFSHTLFFSMLIFWVWNVFMFKLKKIKTNKGIFIGFISTVEYVALVKRKESHVVVTALYKTD